MKNYSSLIGKSTLENEDLIISYLESSGKINSKQVSTCEEQRNRVFMETKKPVSVLEILLSNLYIFPVDLHTAQAVLNVTDRVNYDLPARIKKTLKIICRGIDNNTLYISANRQVSDIVKEQILIEVNKTDNRCISKVVQEPYDLNLIRDELNSLDDVSREDILEFIMNIESGNEQFTTSNQEKLFLMINRYAHSMDASDIYINYEVELQPVHIKIKLKGKTEDVCQLSYSKGIALKNYYITAAKGDSALSNTSQSLSTQMLFDGRHITLRIEATANSTVVRLLDIFKLQPLEVYFRHFPHIANLLTAFFKNNTNLSGCIILAGATGSGKSTTMASMLASIDRSSYRITTSEDPVEMRIPGVIHNEVDGVHNTWTSINSSNLRQNPNVMVIGEMRDENSTRQFMEASKQGFLTISTVHSGTVWEIFSRLADKLNESEKTLQLKDFASNVKILIHQSLSPVLCKHCRIEIDPTHTVYKQLNTSQHLYKRNRNGCNVCNFTGNSGMVLVPEVLVFTLDLEKRAALGTWLAEHSLPQHMETLKAWMGDSYLSKGEATSHLIRQGILCAEENLQQTERR